MHNISTYFLLSICLFLTSCKNAEQQKENQQFSKTLEENLSVKGTGPIDISMLTKTDWDRVCIIPPYSINSFVEKGIGFAWNVETNTNISASDGITLLLFIKNNQVVEFVEHPRGKGDFSSSNLVNCLQKSQAKFNLEVRQGWSYLIKAAPT